MSSNTVDKKWYFQFVFKATDIKLQSAQERSSSNSSLFILTVFVKQLD